MKKKPPIIITEEARRLFEGLNEGQKRRFAALYTAGPNGCSVRSVCEAFEVSPCTVCRGIFENKWGIKPEDGRIRKKGGGAKDKIALHPEWVEAFRDIVSGHIAGDPQNERTVWLNINVPAIRREFHNRGIDISDYHVRRLVKMHGFKSRSFRKDIPMRKVEGRNEQFEKIIQVKQMCIENGIPLISIDTKKKELIGNFKRSGEVLCTAAPKAFDHDFATFSEGTIVPHGIYDVAKNTGYLTIGTSHDTSEFVCDNIEACWKDHLRFIYPDAKMLVILCDGGGSNSSSHHIVKQDLIELAERLGIDILVMHYPPYCSKYNPIEHRLFSQITHSWSGTPLLSIADACARAASTVTKTGLKVISRIVDKVYETGRKVCEQYRELLEQRVVFDNDGHRWNYLIRHA